MLLEISCSLNQVLPAIEFTITWFWRILFHQSLNCSTLFTNFAYHGLHLIEIDFIWIVREIRCVFTFDTFIFLKRSELKLIRKFLIWTFTCFPWNLNYQFSRNFRFYWKFIEFAFVWLGNLKKWCCLFSLVWIEKF